MRYLSSWRLATSGRIAGSQLMTTTKKPNDSLKPVMSKKGVAQKPSETAVFAALHRTIANKELDEKFGPDNLAETFLPPQFKFFLKFKKMRAKTQSRIHQSLPGLFEYMIARTRYFDSLFVDALQKRFPQIVLMGAGYDTRPYRFAHSIHDTKIFELDIGPTQKRKLQCLNKSKITIPQQVSFVPIDFNNESIKDVLEKAGYNPEKKTLFLWEGVTYYLQADSVDATLAFISNHACPGSLILFDYTISVTDQNIKLYGVNSFYQSMKKHHGSEALLFAIDDEDPLFSVNRLRCCDTDGG